MSALQNNFKPYHDPKNSPLGPKNQKDSNLGQNKNQNWRKDKKKTDLKIKSNWKPRIEGIIENESCSTTWADPRKFLNPSSSPRNERNKEN